MRESSSRDYNEGESFTEKNTETSIWFPKDASSSSSEEDEHIELKENYAERRQKLLEFLSLTGQDNVYVLSTTWEEAVYSTRRRHVVQAGKAIKSVLSVLAPNDSADLWKELQASSLINVYLDIGQFNPKELELINGLVECYENAKSWDTRRQFLSIMADKLTAGQLRQLIPGLSRYKLSIARKHSIQYGRGVEVPKTHTPRMRIDEAQLDHFITFITSSHIVQDLPYGEKILKLTTGEVLMVPNSIRMMIPDRICQQYTQYCKETGFEPMGKSTMLTILKECSASIRKSLQGLDYFVVDGMY